MIIIMFTIIILDGDQNLLMVFYATMALLTMFAALSIDLVSHLHLEIINRVSKRILGHVDNVVQQQLGPDGSIIFVGPDGKPVNGTGEILPVFTITGYDLI